MMIKALVRGPSDGVLCPIPQYPLYSAAIALNGGTLLEYYLDETQGWALPAAEVARAIADARKDGVCVRAMAVINPGNPVGNIMDEENMREVRFSQVLVSLSLSLSLSLCLSLFQ